jgi:hypothetical protein
MKLLLNLEIRERLMARMGRLLALTTHECQGNRGGFARFQGRPAKKTKKFAAIAK